MNSSVHFDKKGKDILIIGEGATKRLYDTILKAHAKYLINSQQSGKRLVLSPHNNGTNSFFISLFVNAIKGYQNFQIQIIKRRNKKLCIVFR